MNEVLSPPAMLDPLFERLTAPLPNGGNGKAGSAVPSPNGDNGGRDARGRFQPGNSGGPGNPFARRVAAFRKALCGAVTDQDFRELAARLLQQARHGDMAAAKLLFAYTIGRPAESVDPDTLDLHEWRLHRQTPVSSEDFTAILKGLPMPVACLLLRAILPCVADHWTDELGRRLAPEAESKPQRRPGTRARTSRGKRSGKDRDVQT